MIVRVDINIECKILIKQILMYYLTKTDSFPVVNLFTFGKVIIVSYLPFISKI